MKLQVLYEDNHLIAVFKPAGILSQGDHTGDASIFDEVKDYLKDKYAKKGNVFLGFLHRLDRPVAGIILFAKTSKGANRLSEQFRNHTIEKIYYAVVVGKPTEQRGELVNFVDKVLIPNSKFLIKSQILKPKTRNGKEAVLQYEVIKSNEKYSLLKINLGTGRFHQIRVQLSTAGFPIVGDVKYRGEKWHDPKAIALCALELSFKKATEDQIIHLKIDLSYPHLPLDFNVLLKR